MLLWNAFIGNLIYSYSVVKSAGCQVVPPSCNFWVLIFRSIYFPLPSHACSADLASSICSYAVAVPPGALRIGIFVPCFVDERGGN